MVIRVESTRGLASQSFAPSGRAGWGRGARPAGKGRGGGSGEHVRVSFSILRSIRTSRMGAATSPLVGELFRLRGHEQAAAANDVDPRRLPSGDSGWMAEMVIPPISLKHSPTSGEDQSLRSVSCPRGPFSLITRRQASRMPAVCTSIPLLVSRRSVLRMPSARGHDHRCRSLDRRESQP
jgi:hypothetical protein